MFIRILIIILVSFSVTAEADCLYSPHTRSTIDVYMIVSDFLRAHPIVHTLSFKTNAVDECSMTIDTPQPDRSLRMTLSLFKDHKLSKTATLEVPGSTESQSRAQCLWDRNLAPVMGPISVLEVTGKNGNLTAHLTPDEPGAPYVIANIEGLNFKCTAQ